MLQLLDQLAAARAAAGDKSTAPNFRVDDDLALHGPIPLLENPVRVGALRVDPPSIVLTGNVLASGLRTPRALARLVAGRSARVSTGTPSFQGTDDQSAATVSTAVTIRFDRRR